MKGKVYIAGPITGVENYWNTFERAAERIREMGFIPIDPSVLPEGLAYRDYMRICLAMLDAADCAIFLPGWVDSKGAQLERQYCWTNGIQVLDYPEDLEVLKEVANSKSLKILEEAGHDD